MNSALEFCFSSLSILNTSGGVQIFLFLQALDFVISNKFVTTYWGEASFVEPSIAGEFYILYLTVIL